MEKFDRYGKTEGKERRIDLKQNFRSRRQVTDSVNACFACMMGRDLGGVEYDRDAALYPGASFPEPEGQGEGDVYETEVLLTAAGEDGLDDREREALAIAGKIRPLTGNASVSPDKETGQLRPARYSDIVILLRTTANWDETFKKVLEECGNSCLYHLQNRVFCGNGGADDPEFPEGAEQSPAGYPAVWRPEIGGGRFFR